LVFSMLHEIVSTDSMFDVVFGNLES
jgi:hypothetical protein